MLNCIFKTFGFNFSGTQSNNIPKINRTLLKQSKAYLLILLLSLSTLSLPSLAFANVSNTKLYGDITFPKANAVAKKIKGLHEGDTLELKINSGGGIVEAGDIIRKSIRETKGQVIAVIEGQALSEGAFVAIACHEVKGKGRVMFHVGFQYDDEGRPFTNPQSWGHKQAISLTRAVLTKDEHHRMVKGQDIYMSVDTLKQRLAQKGQGNSNQKTA